MHKIGKKHHHKKVNYKRRRLPLKFPQFTTASAVVITQQNTVLPTEASRPSTHRVLFPELGFQFCLQFLCREPRDGGRLGKCKHGARLRGGATNHPRSKWCSRHHTSQCREKYGTINEFNDRTERRLPALISGSST